MNSLIHPKIKMLPYSKPHLMTHDGTFWASYIPTKRGRPIEENQSRNRNACVNTEERVVKVLRAESPANWTREARGWIPLNWLIIKQHCSSLSRFSTSVHHRLSLLFFLYTCDLQILDAVKIFLARALQLSFMWIFLSRPAASTNFMQ